MGENGGGEVKEKGGSGGTKEKGVRSIFKKISNDTWIVVLTSERCGASYTNVHAKLVVNTTLVTN